jgi:BASS family bile acid:Na+ symporter
MMLGVSLDLKLEDFKRILVAPRAPGIGLAAQFILLPAFTFLLVWILRPHPSMALGMILVASCPGGNLSNIMTYLAKGNCAVSITMTAISTIAAIFMTPLNLSLWGGLNPETTEILRAVSLSPWDVFITVFVILGIPLILGQVLTTVFPGLADRVRRPFKIFALVFFIVIVSLALAANWKYFVAYVGIVMFAVFIHNAMALNIGYWTGRIVGLKQADSRAVCIEVGIQNSALGLILVFNFFDGLGGMAIVVAWWGVWHIIAGLATAFIFTRIPLPPGEAATDPEACRLT